MKIMLLACLSLHHRKVGYADFEKLKFRTPSEFYKISSNIGERVLLQTNTRIEVYALVSGKGKVNSLLNMFKEKNSFRIYFGREAVLHLFRLACGIESRVLGETNLLRQLEDAFHLAKENSAAGAFMSSLFGAAVNAGRRVRSETKIEGAIPVAEIAFKNILPALKHKKVLLVGAGLTGRKAAKILAEHGAELTTINRNYDAAIKIAKEVGGRAVNYRRLGEALSTADVLICATLASHYRVTAELVKSLHRKSLLVIVDVSPFGNVDPAVAALPNIILKNGKLRKAVEKNLESAKAEIPKVERIIEEEIKEVIKWQRKYRWRTIKKSIGK
ncbi:MAG: glutamyl-tRNA reductase [Euryarchaeota archaeon]|nr:glutamyl-tRNA reductase [Euryarchaeota archaeon]